MKFKLGGLWWMVRYDHYSEFHAPHSERSVRRAWWRLWHWNRYGHYCFRLLGLTLHGRAEPWHSHAQRKSETP